MPTRVVTERLTSGTTGTRILHPPGSTNEIEAINVSSSLTQLLEAAKKVEMNSDQREEQRRSFAFGNANFENQDVTRETINQAAAELGDERSGEGR